MKTKTFFTVIGVVFAMQTAVAQNPKREVLFTMGNNEVVHYSEGCYPAPQDCDDFTECQYYTHQQFNKNNFACILIDTISNLETLVINGKRAVTGYGMAVGDNNFLNDYGRRSCSFDGMINNGYTGVVAQGEEKYALYIKGKKYGNYNKSLDFIYKEEKDEYAFAYQKKGSKDWYVNINGKEDGAFDFARVYYIDSLQCWGYGYMLAGRMFDNVDGKMNKSKRAYTYQYAGKIFVNVNGEVSKGYSNVRDLTYYDNGKYAYVFSDTYTFVNINGEVSKGCGYVRDFTYYANGKYAYTFRENDDDFVNINGKELKGYNLTYYENGKYAYCFSEKDANNNYKYFVNINGDVSKEYNWVSNLTYYADGKYAYVFSERENNGKYKYCVNINGKISKVYDSDGNSNTIYLTYYANGKYAYTFEENGKYFVNINGEISKGYDNVGERYNYNENKLIFYDNGKYAYCFEENGKSFVNINGEISKGYDHIVSAWWGNGNGWRNLIYYDNGKYAYCFKEDDKWFVNINGKVSKGYDDVNNNDIRYYANGKYAYSFEENDKYFVNINGELSKGYDNIGQLNYQDDGKYTYTFDYYYNGRYDNINGKIEYEAYHFRTIGLYSPKGTMFYSDDEYKYVVIDGKRFGKAPAVDVWYDENKNAFIWTAIEGKELVIYEYKD